MKSWRVSILEIRRKMVARRRDMPTTPGELGTDVLFEHGPPEVFIADTGTARGRGVFAARSFQPGELIERCPCVPIGAPFGSLPSSLRQRVFSWRALTGSADNPVALPLGYGAMYNHAEPSNCEYKADGDTLLIVAVEAIGAHEEITINYNAPRGGTSCNDNRWFDRQGITPI